MIDPYRERMRVANHESGHAVSFWMCGRPIHEIDIDRPDSGFAGWVKPGKTDMPDMPEGLDPAAVIDWCDAYYARAIREVAVCARVGGLVAGDDWHGPACKADRALVRDTHPAWLSPDLWEEFVLSFAEEMLADPRFAPACKALSRALLERPHEAMSGDRAVEIIEAALHEQAVVAGAS
jgi:hypothetical protein